MGDRPLLIIGSNGVRISAIECSMSRRFAEECNPTTGAHFLELSVSIYLFNALSQENAEDCNPGGVLIRSCNCTSVQNKLIFVFEKNKLHLFILRVAVKT